MASQSGGRVRAIKEKNGQWRRQPDVRLAHPSAPGRGEQSGRDDCQQPAEDRYPLAAQHARCEDGKQAASGRAEQVDKIHAGSAAGLDRQQQPDGRAAAKERRRQCQVVQGQDADLLALPGDAERIERQQVDERHASQAGEGKPDPQPDQRALRPASPPARKQRQRGTAGPKSQQRQADDHKGKVVELGHGKEPRQVDLKEQRGGREQEEAQVERHLGYSARAR